MATQVLRIAEFGDEQGVAAAVTVTYDDATFRAGRADWTVNRGRLGVLLSQEDVIIDQRETTTSGGLAVPGNRVFNPTANTVNKIRFDFYWSPS